jgi:8-oxo-dGTP diphosphatase
MTTGARFCPRCAAALPGLPPTRCTGCGYALFVNPRPSSSVVILSDGHFLALRRAAEPKRGCWEVPGGFCDGWEHPAEAAVREAREELGVEISLDEFLGMYIGSYDYQDETLPVLDCFWLAHIVSGTVTLDPGESEEYRWLPLAGAPPLAFATMDRALADLRSRRPDMALPR